MFKNLFEQVSLPSTVVWNKFMLTYRTWAKNLEEPGLGDQYLGKCNKIMV